MQGRLEEEAGGDWRRPGWSSASERCLHGAAGLGGVGGGGLGSRGWRGEEGASWRAQHGPEGRVVPARPSRAEGGQGRPGPGSPPGAVSSSGYKPGPPGPRVGSALIEVRLGEAGVWGRLTLLGAGRLGQTERWKRSSSEKMPASRFPHWPQSRGPRGAVEWPGVFPSFPNTAPHNITSECKPSPRSEEISDNPTLSSRPARLSLRSPHTQSVSRTEPSPSLGSGPKLRAQPRGWRGNHVAPQDSGVSWAGVRAEQSPSAPGIRPSTPRLTQAQEGGGPRRHGPALSRRALDSVLKDGACSLHRRGCAPGPLWGGFQPTASHKGEERPPRSSHFPPRGPRGSSQLLLPLSSHEAQLLSGCTLRGEPHSPPMSRTHFVQHTDLTISPDSVLGQKLHHFMPTVPRIENGKLRNPPLSV